MLVLTVKGGFAAAHRVTIPGAGVERLHGHNWGVQFSVATESLDSYGMGADFLALQKLLKEKVLGRLDHSSLEDTGLFPAGGATTERVALFAFEALKEGLEAGFPRLRLKSVTVSESPEASVTIENE